MQIILRLKRIAPGLAVRKEALTLLGLGVLVACLISSSLWAQRVVPVSLCDIFANLGRWDGQMVEVRGVIEPGSGYWLAGRDCSAATKVDNVSFANIIAMIDPKDFSDVAIHSVPYAWDQASRRSLYEAIYYARFRHERVRATIIGLYETQTPLREIGFGAQGLAPAQILVREVKDIAAEPDPRK